MEDYRDRRTSVTSFKSNSSDGSRRNSVDSSRRNSSSGSKRNSTEQIRQSSLSKQEQSTESILVIGENQNSFVESKFCRTGSIQYRNAGWKSSHQRNDSTSSSRSNASGKQVHGMKQSQPRKVVPQRSPEEQNAHIKQTFIEIAAILKDSGVDEDILQKIRSTA